MILEARNVMYSYQSKRDKVVLKNVSAAFEEAVFYAIVGSSGSGKTTFLSLLAGLDTPVSGSILYDGEEIREKGLNDHRRRHVSLVFQNYNLIDYLTAEENVKLGGQKDAGKLLKEVSIPCEDWKRNVLQLSGGQQQRVAIARALASDAKVLLADEPTGNLDEDTADEIIGLLKKTAHESGKCVIVVTHSKQLAEQADVVLEISQGTLQERDDFMEDALGKKIKESLYMAADKFLPF